MEWALCVHGTNHESEIDLPDFVLDMLKSRRCELQICCYFLLKRSLFHLPSTTVSRQVFYTFDSSADCCTWVDPEAAPILLGLLSQQGKSHVALVFFRPWPRCQSRQRFACLASQFHRRHDRLLYYPRLNVCHCQCMCAFFHCPFSSFASWSTLRCSVQKKLYRIVFFRFSVLFSCGRAS